MDSREEAINRMMRILERFVRKFKIAICAPLLIEKPRFKNIFERYCNIEEFKKLHKLCVSANLKGEQKSFEECFSKDVAGGQVETELRWAIISENLSKYETDILLLINDSFDEFMPTYSYVLSHMELLKKIMEWQMGISPKQLRERKIELRNAEVLIAAAQNEIEKLESSFNDELLKHDDVVIKSQGEISDLNIVIDELKRKHHEELEHEMHCYQTTLRGLRNDMAEEENNLDNQLEAHEIMLEQLTEANMQQEKLLRRRCIKAEKACLVARNRYDRDLDKLNKLKETLEIQLYLTNNHYDILKNEYDVQGVLYTNLKKERELAMMQAFAEQIDNFKKKRAACIIQRNWRAYHERISSKKKKRSRRNK